MSTSIEKQVEDLLQHAEVWDETKETLRDLLSEYKTGKLDPDDARYIEGLHAKMFGGRGGASSSAAASKPVQNRARDFASVKPANDDATLRSAKRGLSQSALIEALRLDVADLVIGRDIHERPEAEQNLRREIVESLNSTLNVFDETKEG